MHVHVHALHCIVLLMNHHNDDHNDDDDYYPGIIITQRHLILRQHEQLQSMIVPEYWSEICP